MPIADMRQVVTAIDDRPRHSSGGCNLSKQTPRPAAAASEMGQERKSRALQARCFPVSGPSMGNDP
jgi:hypothetical protein